MRPQSFVAIVLPCKHLETIYLGNVAQHTFETEDGQHLHMEELKPRQRDWNGEVRVAFASDDLIVLAD